jgi:hypothetical protein
MANLGKALSAYCTRATFYRENVERQARRLGIKL